MQAAPGVYAIHAVGSTAYLLGGVELTLVDAGGPGSAPRVVGAIRALERQPADLTRILVTHADLDHVGGLAPLVEATGARVYAHPLALERLGSGEIPLGERGLRSSLTGLRRYLSPVGRARGEPLADGQELPVLGGLEAILTGGHSPDQAVYFVRQGRALFAGDLLGLRGTHLDAFPGPTPSERAQTVDALRRLAALDPLAIFPGHGPIYRDNIAVRLVRLAEILEE